MARRDNASVRLLTRNGHDWSPRYPAIVEAVNHLKVRSCLIDGEAVACDENGLAVFERLRRKPTGRHVLLYAFDLLELDGEDLRREPFETRVFRHACKMGLEGIVSKRKDSAYRSGRSPDWLKRLTAHMSSSSERPQVRRSRSQSQEPRPA